MERWPSGNPLDGLWNLNDRERFIRVPVRMTVAECGHAMSLLGDIFSAANEDIFRIKTRAAGPVGSLPLTEEMLRDRPSGDIFGLTQNAGMGWDPSEAG